MTKEQIAREYVEQHESQIFEIPMNELLEIYSGEFDGKLGDIWDEIDVDAYEYDSIREHMREAGTNLVPILIYEGDDCWGERTLGNGHHRFRMAYELGFASMRATHDDELSGWAYELSRVVI